MLEELERLVILDPEVRGPGKGPFGNQFTGLEIQGFHSPDHRKVPLLQTDSAGTWTSLILARLLRLHHGLLDGRTGSGQDHPGVLSRPQDKLVAEHLGE